jgi:hypothetical protein
LNLLKFLVALNIQFYPLSHDSNHCTGTVLLFPEYAKDGAILTEQQLEERNDEKTTANGITLFPQPEETPNDPLNLPVWRRNAALMALGFYCMLGGGMAPLLATGFPYAMPFYLFLDHTI